MAAVDAEIVAFAEEDAEVVGEMTRLSRPLGLSVGDRACLALALSTQATAVTAERSWSRLALDGLHVELIR